MRIVRTDNIIAITVYRKQRAKMVYMVDKEVWNGPFKKSTTKRVISTGYGGEIELDDLGKNYQVVDDEVYYKPHIEFELKDADDFTERFENEEALDARIVEIKKMNLPNFIEL